MIDMQYENFQELKVNEIFSINGGEYDRINSCFNTIINILHNILNKN